MVAVWDVAAYRFHIWIQWVSVLVMGRTSLWDVQRNMPINAKGRFIVRQSEFRDEIVHVSSMFCENSRHDMGAQLRANARLLSRPSAR